MHSISIEFFGLLFIQINQLKNIKGCLVLIYVLGNESEDYIFLDLDIVPGYQILALGLFLLMRSTIHLLPHSSASIRPVFPFLVLALRSKL